MQQRKTHHTWDTMALPETKLRDGYEPELTESELHKLLADKERRLALEILADRTNMRLTDVATEIAAQNAKDGTLQSKAIDQVKVRLHHIHLPKLDEFGLIEYNPKSGRINV